MFEYIVPVSKKPSREELEWAWRFSVLAHANGRCEHCGREGHLHCAHKLARRERPDLEWDPANGIGLCASCHLKHDHQNGHRPSGRPFGHKLSQETKRRIGERNRIAHSTPEAREFSREKAIREWNARGRKPPRDCEHCGKPLARHQLSSDRRFCSPGCHYAFRAGKPRSGY